MNVCESPRQIPTLYFEPFRCEMRGQYGSSQCCKTDTDYNGYVGVGDRAYHMDVNHPEQSCDELE